MGEAGSEDFLEIVDADLGVVDDTAIGLVFREEGGRAARVTLKPDLARNIALLIFSTLAKLDTRTPTRDTVGDMLVSDVEVHIPETRADILVVLRVAETELRFRVPHQLAVQRAAAVLRQGTSLELGPKQADRH